jgi:hypothetical protein
MLKLHLQYILTPWILKRSYIIDLRVALKIGISYPLWSEKRMNMIWQCKIHRKDSLMGAHRASPVVVHVDVGLLVEQPLWHCRGGPHMQQCAAQYRRQGWCCKSSSLDVTLQVNSIEMCNTKTRLQPQSTGKFQNLTPEWLWFGNLHSNCTLPQSKMNTTLSFQAYPWANAKTSATYRTF